MKVLVTGAAGFIGRRVVTALERRDHAVRAVVRRGTGTDDLGWGANVEVFRSDLGSDDAVRIACEGIDAAIHLAATVTGDYESQLTDTLLPTERLMRAIRGSSVRRVVLASSFAVYDWGRIRGRLTEEAPLETRLYERDAYTAAKVWQERVVRCMAREAGVALTVLRPGLVWGLERSYLPRVGQRIGPFQLVIGWRNEPPLSFVENCAGCFVRAVESSDAADHTFNVIDFPGARSGWLMREHMRRGGSRALAIPIPFPVAFAAVRLVARVARLLLGPRARLPSFFVPCRFEARFRPIHADVSQLQQRLGWKPPVPLAVALEQTYRDPAAES